MCSSDLRYHTERPVDICKEALRLVEQGRLFPVGQDEDGMETYVSVHDPKAHFSAVDYIEGRTGRWEGGFFRQDVVTYQAEKNIAYRAGYYTVPEAGGMCYMHTDGTLCRIPNGQGELECPCGYTHTI